jgi:hypothetical protein
MFTDLTKLADEPRKPNVHVRPHGAGWAVIFSGTEEPHSVHADQADALRVARDISKRDGVLVVIYHADGTVRNSETNAP